MQNQKVLILNFGGQYDQLIARRVRECSVYCEVKPYTMTLSEIRAFDPIGIIFTGGPDSVYKENSYHPAEGIFELGIPILGICYGCQLLAHHLGGMVTAAENENAREYGKTLTFYDNSCLLFDGLDEESISWMSHGDYMRKVPDGFRLVARSGKCPNVAICDENRKYYGVQFHPEVNHTENGTAMIRNFLYKVCGAVGDWTMESYMYRCIEEIRSKVGNDKVLLALSGGVDSSVCAALFAEAVGSQLTCVFVDHGFLRKDEGDEVEKAFEKWNINLIRVNAGERFLKKLEGITEPEQKRKIIGEEFIRVFEEEGKKIGRTDYLALAVMIFGNWKPGNIAAASLLFGLFKCVAAAYSSIDINGDGVFLLAQLGISSHLYRMLPYLVTLAVLAFTSKKSRAPKAEGIPYDKGSR